MLELIIERNLLACGWGSAQQESGRYRACKGTHAAESRGMVPAPAEAAATTTDAAAPGAITVLEKIPMQVFPPTFHFWVSQFGLHE